MRRYDSGVRQMIAKLLVMLALLLMPFGMAPAAAHDHQVQPEMAMQHCPEQQPGHQSKAGLAACTMVCASALPAAELVRAEPMSMSDVPVVAAAMRALDGLHPEIATPPPKLD